MNFASCHHCRYRHEDECRRYPPHVSVVMIVLFAAKGQ